jgi:glycosyltransferase involved in cell wall biosynthesis
VDEDNSIVKMKKHKKVSVIIPTYNEEKNIDSCLASIKNQTYKPIEIIVVDQTSSDNTVNIARRYTDKVIILKKPPFYSPPAKSRNIGVSKSSGEFLVNIDADMTLPRKLIEDCVKKIEDFNFVGIILHEKDIAKNFWAKCRALEKECMINDPYFEGTRFVTRKSFFNIGGFDSDLGSGEDWDFYARLKKTGKIGYSAYFIHHHTGKKNIITNFKKMMNYGKTFDRYIKKHPELSKKQLTPFRVMYIKNWKLLLKHHLLTSGLIILKLSEFLGAAIGLIKGKTRA